MSGSDTGPVHYVTTRRPERPLYVRYQETLLVPEGMLRSSSAANHLQQETSQWDKVILLAG